MYDGVKAKLSAADLLGKSTMSDESVNTLMNLIAQFRKVCNHPELFERRDVVTPLHWVDPLAAQLLRGASASIGGSTGGGGGGGGGSGGDTGAGGGSGGASSGGNGGVASTADAIAVVPGSRNPIQLPLPRLLWEPLDALQAADQVGPTFADRWRLLHVELGLWQPAMVHASDGPLAAAARLLDLTPAEAYTLATSEDPWRRWLLVIGLMARRAVHAHERVHGPSGSLGPKPERAGLIVDLSAPAGPVAQAEAAAAPASALSPLAELLQVHRSADAQHEAVLSDHLLACLLPAVTAEPVHVVATFPGGVWAEANWWYDAPHKLALAGAPLAPRSASGAPVFGSQWALLRPWRPQVSAPPPDSRTCPFSRCRARCRLRLRATPLDGVGFRPLPCRVRCRGGGGSEGGGTRADKHRSDLWV